MESGKPDKRADAAAPEDTSVKPASASQFLVADAAMAVSVHETLSSVPNTGRRQSVRNVARQLNPEELTNSGVIKLIIENLDRAEDDCEGFELYVDRFHGADKQCAVFAEKLRTQASIEVAFGVGVGLGCALIGLSPSLWDASYKGPMILAMGILLVLGGVAVRVIKR